MKLEELIFTAICMLLGKEGVDFDYFEKDYYLWQLCLDIRRN